MSNTTIDFASVQNDVLDAIKESQEFTLGAVRTVAEAIRPLTSSLPTPNLPSEVPTPAQAVDASFKFFGQLIDAQRDFTRQLLDVLTPASGGSAS
jgi:hypothetical protein